MTTLIVNGRTFEVRYRRVPGYYNGSTYNVEVDGVHVMDVRRASDATWSRSAHWSTYRPGVDWATRHNGRVDTTGFHLGGDTSRSAAVKASIRKLHLPEPQQEVTA